MGCQKTKCRTCGVPYKACQLVNGECKSCRLKEKPSQQKPTTTVAKELIETIISNNDVYYT